MRLEKRVADLILDCSYKFWKESLGLDVAIVGSGPSGLTCAIDLAKEGHNVGVFERHLLPGGGMPGGGMGYPFIVVEEDINAKEDAVKFLTNIGVRLIPKNDCVKPDLYAANSVEVPVKLAAAAIDAGAKILTGVAVEDLIIKNEHSYWRVEGIVINSYAIEKAKLHVDPLTVISNYVVDATGHDAYLVKTLARKNPEFNVKCLGEASMEADLAEKLLLMKTGSVFPGLYVTGMAVNAVYGLPRMGAIFGGMFMSGKKCAEMISKRLKEEKM
jgi:sulfide-dependent adenosine diphosphate thiazole synthase